MEVRPEFSGLIPNSSQPSGELWKNLWSGISGKGQDAAIPEDGTTRTPPGLMENSRRGRGGDRGSIGRGIQALSRPGAASPDLSQGFGESRFPEERLRSLEPGQGQEMFAFPWNPAGAFSLGPGCANPPFPRAGNWEWVDRGAPPAPAGVSREPLEVASGQENIAASPHPGASGNSGLGARGETQVERPRLSRSVPDSLGIGPPHPGAHSRAPKPGWVSGSARCNPFPAPEAFPNVAVFPGWTRRDNRGAWEGQGCRGGGSLECRDPPAIHRFRLRNSEEQLDPTGI